MKKLISFIIAFSLILSVLPVIVFADDGDLAVAPPPPQQDKPFDADYSASVTETPSLADTYVDALDQDDDDDEEPAPEPERDVIPDDGFEGGYKDFTAKDGSNTRVYDNGSIVTTYPDGSREGMDYNGNRYTEDRDGKQVIYDIDGNQRIRNADGSEEAISKDGTHTYFNEDGSCRAVAATGTVFEYDANDDLVAVSIEGGERLSLVDENGDFITGEHVVTGPDGKKFTFVNNSDSDTDTTELKMWSEGNGKEFGIDGKFVDGNGSGTFLTPQGVKIEVSNNVTENDDKSGSNVFDLKITDLTNGFSEHVKATSVWDQNGNEEISIRGTTSEAGEFLSFDSKFKDGEQVSSIGRFVTYDGETINYVAHENEVSFTNSNGTFLKGDPNTGALEFYDPKSGDHIKINDDGVVEIFQLTDDDESTMNYENGQFVIRDKDGNVTTVIEKDEETGATTVTKDGDSYTVTKDSKVFKNGKEARAETETQTEEQDFDPAEGHYSLTDAYTRGVKENFVDEDDLQRVTYIYEAGTDKHAFTMKYEPLGDDYDPEYDIPPYEISALCECIGIPAGINPGETVKVTLKASSVQESEWAAISFSCWLFSEDNNGRVSVTCDEGLGKGDIFAGEGDNGKKKSSSATFSIKVADIDIENSEDFNIVFQTEIGETVFHYKWVEGND